jgi:hypothetical protein
LEVDEARELLGAFIAGNQTEQTQALWEKANLWADQVRTGQWSQAEVWFSIQYCVMKLLQYLLMATSLSKVQCNRIMKPIQAAVLPALGINCHINL